MVCLIRCNVPTSNMILETFKANVENIKKPKAIHQHPRTSCYAGPARQFCHVQYVAALGVDPNFMVFQEVWAVNVIIYYFKCCCCRSAFQQQIHMNHRYSSCISYKDSLEFLFDLLLSSNFVYFYGPQPKQQTCLNLIIQQNVDVIASRLAYCLLVLITNTRSFLTH